MEPRRLTAACQSCAVRAAMPFPLDCDEVLAFFTLAVLGMGKVACALGRLIVQRVAERSRQTAGESAIQGCHDGTELCTQSCDMLRDDSPYQFKIDPEVLVDDHVPETDYL